MRVTPLAPLGLLLGLSLAACGPVNRGLETINQPVVTRTDYVFDLPAEQLAGGDTTQLSAWLEGLQVGYGDRIAVDDPSPGREGASRDALGAVLSRYGLLASTGAPMTEGAIADGAVRVVVSRSTATVPHCPNWDRPSEYEFASSSMSNFGCATSSNLAAMVADPADLLSGRRGSPDARTVTKAIEAYRKRPVSGTGELKAESTGGK